MAKTKEQKRTILEELKKKIAQQKAMIFVDFKGLKVKDLSKLRNELKQKDSEFMVGKKTLMKIALEDNKLECNPEEMEGEIALVFGFKDELFPIKTVYNFSKENENLKIIGGYIESQKKEFLSAENIITLGQLPGKEELLARLVGSLSAPISNFNNVLQAPLEACLSIIKSLGEIKASNRGKQTLKV